MKLYLYLKVSPGLTASDHSENYTQMISSTFRSSYDRRLHERTLRQFSSSDAIRVSDASRRRPS